MVNRYKQIIEQITIYKPKTIIEIGTWNGKRATLMAQEALKHQKQVHYTGFDLFEEATKETDAEEYNVKKNFTLEIVTAVLDRVVKQNEGFSFELVRGNTRETLKGPRIADFVFIDGGHSIQTIQSDYEALKNSLVILFDDYYEGGPNTTLFGCNKIVQDLDHSLLPVKDPVKGGGYVGIAMVIKENDDV